MSNMTIHRIRLSKMQKIVNFIALTSGAVSLAVVASGIYVYVQRDQLIDTVKQQALEAVLGGSGGLGGALGGSSIGGDTLPIGANDLSPSAPQVDGSGTTSASGFGVSPL